MEKSKSLLFLLLSVLLLFKIFKSTTLSQHCNLPSTDRVYNYVVPNLQLLLPKPVTGHTRHPVGRKILPSRLPPVIDEDDMVTLSEKNFSDFMAKNRHVMVVFYTPKWRIAPEHATQIMKLVGAAVVAKVDFSEEKKLAEKHKLVRYPSIYFFPGGADLADKYYSEVILEAHLEELRAEKIRGNFVGRSDEDDMESAVTESEALAEPGPKIKVENLTQISVSETSWGRLHEYVQEKNDVILLNTPPQAVVVSQATELNAEDEKY